MTEISGENYDLFGVLIPAGHGRRGRPEHIASPENANKVMLLLAQGWSNQRIAAAMNITVPTLRKHYFSILKTRDTAADMVNARHLVLLWNQCEAGNVAALKEFARIMSNLMPETFKRKVETEKQQVGKKEQLRRDAEQPVSGWEGLVPPRDVVN